MLACDGCAMFCNGSQMFLAGPLLLWNRSGTSAVGMQRANQRCAFYFRGCVVIATT
jgi:hypothetical protein